MEQNETGCRAPLECPILCINNCGFFGTAATMNMCSKCYKDIILQQEKAKLAASSIGSIVNSISNPIGSEPHSSSGSRFGPTQLSHASVAHENSEGTNGTNRCSTCRKRVGLTGFSCRCGNLFCSVHRYSDKHECPFDYQTAARDAIASANPVVKAQKLDKI